MTAENQAKSQYTFDVIAAHLLTQGKPSMAVIAISDGKPALGCAYRGDNGLRCAVGFCIPNENYTRNLETLSASHQAVTDAIGPQYCNDKMFLTDLQGIHDGIANSIPDWVSGLNSFAADYELDSSIVATFMNAQIPQPALLVETHA